MRKTALSLPNVRLMTQHINGTSAWKRLGSRWRKSKTGWMAKYPREESRPSNQPRSTPAYIFTGAIFAAKPFGVMRYAASLPSLLRSIQLFLSSFDINFGLSGKLVARRHAASRKY